MKVSPRSLAPGIVAHLAIPAAGVLYVDHAFFALPPARRAALAWVDPVLVLVALALVSVILRLWVAPIHAAWSKRPGARDERTLRRAARAALALPARAAWSVLPVALVTLAVTLAVKVVAGMSADLVVAAAAAGMAVVITVVMLAYCSAHVSASRFVVDLPSPELRQRSTMGSKVVLFSMGLASAVLLMTTAVGYAEHRAWANRQHVVTAQETLERTIATVGPQAAAELRARHPGGAHGGAVGRRPDGDRAGWPGRAAHPPRPAHERLGGRAGGGGLARLGAQGRVPGWWPSSPRRRSRGCDAATGPPRSPSGARSSSPRWSW